MGCHGYAHPITKPDWDPTKAPAELRPKDAGAPDAAPDGGVR